MFNKYTDLWNVGSVGDSYTYADLVSANRASDRSPPLTIMMPHFTADTTTPSHAHASDSRRHPCLNLVVMWPEALPL